MLGDVGLEGLGRGEPERAREPGAGRGLVGAHVGLDAARHLHGVLGAAERDVPERDLLGFAIGDEALGAEAAQAVEGVARAHPRLFAAPHELERLHEELGLADAAGPELEVAIGVRGELGARALRELDHLAGDARIDATPPDEGREHRHELVAEAEITRGGPRPEQGRALPEAAEVLVVALRGGERVHERTAPSLGSQSQIHAPDEAVFGHLFERRGEPPRHAAPVVVERDWPGAAAGGSAVVGVVKIDEIDVRAGVELLAAELAHAEDHEAPGRAARRQRRAEARRRRGDRLGERDLHGHVGEGRELTRGDVDVGAAEGRRQDLAQRDPDPLVAGRAPQLAPHPIDVVEIADAGADAHRQAGAIARGERAVVDEGAGDLGRGLERGREGGVGRREQHGDRVGGAAAGEARREAGRGRGRSLGIDRLREGRDASSSLHGDGARR